MNYNLGVQHQLGSNFSLEVAYVGNHGYRLLSFADINQAPLGAAIMSECPLTAAQLADACGPVQCRRDDGSGRTGSPAVLYQVPISWDSSTSQRTSRIPTTTALQVTLTKRMSQGLSFTAGYTYGHGLDNGSLNRFGLIPQNSNNLAAEYASSDFDIRHRFTFTVTYNIPGKKGFGQLLEGWQINAIVNYPLPSRGNIRQHRQYQRDRENADRWNIFGNPADFPSGKNSIPYCGVTPGLPAGTPFGPTTVTCGFADPYNAGSIPIHVRGRYCKRHCGVRS